MTRPRAVLVVIFLVTRVASLIAAEPKIEGSVQGPKGPLEGAKVTATFSESTAVPPDAANLDDGRILETLVYETDADGKYRVEVPAQLADNPRLRVSISVAHPEHFGRSIGPVPVADFSGRKIETGTAYWMHRQLAQAAVKTTRLRAAKRMSGQVLTADGLPAASASVSMRTKYQPYAWKFHSADDYQATDSAVTDEQGRFTIRTDFQTTLVVTLEDHAPLVIDDLDKYPGIGGGENVLRLPPGFRARGRVLAFDGTPLAGAIVVAAADNKWNEFDMPLPVTRGQAADRFGNFELPPLPAGRYRFRVDSRVADVERIDEYNRHFDVPTEPLTNEILDQLQPIGPGGGEIELRGVETVSVECRMEFPDGPPDVSRTVDLTVTGKVDGHAWSGRSVKAGVDGLAELVVPRGAEEVVIGTFLARHRLSPDAAPQIGTAIHLGTVDEDISGVVVTEPRLATLKIKLKLPTELDRQIASSKAHLSITAVHAREGLLGRHPQPQQVHLTSGMQTNSDTFSGKALPNEEVVIRVYKRADKVDTLLHEERLMLAPGEERLREIEIQDKL
jgi:hypothetical protein